MSVNLSAHEAEERRFMIAQSRHRRVEPGPQALERRRRVRRTAVLLGLVAASFYIGFMILTYFRSQH